MGDTRYYDMTSQIKILVTDANDLARHELCGELASYHYRVLEAACGEEAILQIHQRPDMVILDMDLPPKPRASKSEGAGLAIGRAFREADPATGIVFYCSNETHVRVAEAMYVQGSGGVGYVSKESSVTLAAVLPSVIAGNWVCVLTKPLKSFISEETYLQNLADTPRAIVLKTADGIARYLSEDERQTLMMIGQSNQAIANQLFVGLKRVESRFTSIYQKLELEEVDRRLRAILLDRALGIYTIRQHR